MLLVCIWCHECVNMDYQHKKKKRCHSVPQCPDSSRTARSVLEQHGGEWAEKQWATVFLSWRNRILWSTPPRAASASSAHIKAALFTCSRVLHAPDAPHASLGEKLSYLQDLFRLFISALHSFNAPVYKVSPQIDRSPAGFQWCDVFYNS